MIRKSPLRLLILAFPLLLAGCWDSKELNSIGIVAATAIDRSEDRWVVSFQVIIPQSIATQTGGGGAGNQSPITIFSTRGRTLREAMQLSSSETSRELFFSHNTSLIISEQVARDQGVGQILDMFLRPAESRETMSVLLAKGRASDLLEVLIPMEKISGNAIHQVLLKGQRNLSQVQNTKLIDLASAVANPNKSAIAPELGVSGNQEEQSTLDALKSTRSKAVIKLADTGVFKRDKLVGWLNPKQSRGVAWLSDRIHRLIVVFPCDAENTGSRLSSYRVLGSSTKLHPSIANGRMRMDVKIETQGTLDEVNCDTDISKPQTIDRLEMAIADQIKDEAETGWERMKELNADAAGIGDVFFKKYPKEWSRLGQKEHPLDEIELKIDAKVRIEHTDMINKPYSSLLENVTK